MVIVSRAVAATSGKQLRNRNVMVVGQSVVDESDPCQENTIPELTSIKTTNPDNEMDVIEQVISDN